MKGRLIAQPCGFGLPMEIRALVPGAPVPEGWEELHAVRSILADLCACGHARGHHVGHRGKCMVLADAPCPCEAFSDA